VGLRGPGLFWVVPFIDRVATRVDQRPITTSFAAEQTVTSDTCRSTSTPCCVTVSSVEMRDVVIPGALQDAMSREAQARARSRRVSSSEKLAGGSEHTKTGS
jgi:regulator of protease activity HflC (stomatin/prohibitin superfamily)